MLFRSYCIIPSINPSSVRFSEPTTLRAFLAMAAEDLRSIHSHNCERRSLVRCKSFQRHPLPPSGVDVLSRRPLCWELEVMIPNRIVKDFGCYKCLLLPCVQRGIMKHGDIIDCYRCKGVVISLGLSTRADPLEGSAM